MKRKQRKTTMKKYLIIRNQNQAKKEIKKIKKKATLFLNLKVLKLGKIKRKRKRKMKRRKAKNDSFIFLFLVQLI